MSRVSSEAPVLMTPPRAWPKAKPARTVVKRFNIFAGGLSAVVS